MPPRSELPAFRVIRRLAFALIFFALIDILVGRAVTRSMTPAFDSQYRFKSGTDITSLRLYVDHIGQIHANNTDNRKIVAFLGASPTYGYRIKNARNTYPYAFESTVNTLMRKPEKTQKEVYRNAVQTGAEAAADLKHNMGPRTIGDIDDKPDTKVVIPPAYNQSPKTIKAYNLASNGQLVADQYYIAKALIGNADAFVIQLNYHTFNPHDANRPHIRYADLPHRLGGPVSSGEAKTLGSTRTLDQRANATLSSALSRYSFTFAQRDYITSTVFGGSPKALFAQLNPATAGAGTDIVDGKTTPINGGAGSSAGGAEANALAGDTGESSKPFDSLSAAQKLLIIKRCSQLYDYKIDPNDSEIFFLKRLLALLAEHKKRAFFFIAPLNVQALDEYGIYSWDSYDANSKTLRSIVEAQGFPFADANLGAGVVAADQFFDISHTTDAGGIACGKWITDLTAGYIWERQ
ncbi:MAG TPA: hypothetical protein VGK02_07650 [Candidatus Aquicultor sp.]